MFMVVIYMYVINFFNVNISVTMHDELCKQHINMNIMHIHVDANDGKLE